MNIIAIMQAPLSTPDSRAGLITGNTSVFGVIIVIILVALVLWVAIAKKEGGGK